MGSVQYRFVATDTLLSNTANYYPKSLKDSRVSTLNIVASSGTSELYLPITRSNVLRRQLDSLSDEDMVNELRSHIMDANSPNPYVILKLSSVMNTNTVLQICRDTAARVFASQGTLQPVKFDIANNT